MPDRLVIDASTMVDLLLGSGPAPRLHERIRGHELNVPAHFDAEVVSALGRLERGGHLSEAEATERVGRVSDAPLERHPLPPLLAGAWGRRGNLRLVDALYVELAEQIDAVVITRDARLAATSPRVEYLA